MTRLVRHRYEDPLDALWIDVARRVGLRVVRVPDAYASTDGCGTVLLSDAAGFDADDCLAQMILHELCHALVQGPESFSWVDWGLDNEGVRDDAREHACLRLQAALLEPYGLRRVLGPTTDFREFYDALPADPFQERTFDERESIVLARHAWTRRTSPPFEGHLLDGIERTARVLEALDGLDVAPVVTNDSTLLDSATVDSTPLDSTPRASLWKEKTRRTPLHRVGFPLHPDVSSSCSSCAWAVTSRGALRCTQANATTRADAPACERYEPELDCTACGACCREAYDVVLVSKRDPAVALHADLLTPSTTGFDLRRDDGRCNALRGGVELAPVVPAIAGGRQVEDGRRVLPRYMPGHEPFSCSIYETRPRTCRDFTRSSQNCMEARRSVGLSR